MSSFEQISIHTLLDNSILVTTMVAIFIVLLIVTSMLPFIREYMNEHKINKAIQKMGSQYLRQVILPDGMGGSIFLDYIVLSQNKIILVILKKFHGAIFCADNIDQWTQLVGNRSYKFPNILQQLDSDISSIHLLVKDISVSGLVLFPNECEFPKGKPEQVKKISELVNLGIDKQLHSEKLLNSWYTLKELTNNHSSTQSFANDYFKVQNIKKDYSIPIVLTCVLIAWLVWRIHFATL